MSFLPWVLCLFFGRLMRMMVGEWMDGAQLEGSSSLTYCPSAWVLEIDRQRHYYEDLTERISTSLEAVLFPIIIFRSASPLLEANKPSCYAVTQRGLGSQLSQYFYYITIADNSTAVQLGLSYYSKVKSPASCMIFVAPLMRSMLLQLIRPAYYSKAKPRQLHVSQSHFCEPSVGLQLTRTSHSIVSEAQLHVASPLYDGCNAETQQLGVKEKQILVQLVERISQKNPSV